MTFWMKKAALLGLTVVMSASVWADEQKIRDTLKRVAPSMVITGIQKTPMNGLFAVTSEAGTLYASHDGQFLLSGDLMQVKGKQVVSLTEQADAARRVKLLNAVDPKDAVVFKAQGKAKAVITVFTDVDCGYCRKLHAEVPEMNRLGIEVRYLAYPRDLPRSGLNAGTSLKLADVWCSPNQNAAMTAAKQGRPVAKAGANCKAPIKQQYDLGGLVGVRGTPAIFSQTGEQIGGYVSAKDAASRLGLR